jgi:hypothetical protein
MSKRARSSTPNDAALERMAEAGVEVVKSIHALETKGTNLVAEALGGREFIEYEHYPSNDVYDPKTHAQYYFHAHPQRRGRMSEYGHFHTFLRAAALSGAASEECPRGADGGPLCHLVAISMSREGRPLRLFTTNRWVTAEAWHPAATLISSLDRFEIGLSWPSSPLNRWITAMFTLFRDEIVELLSARDAAVARWRHAHSDRDVFEDRGLEVTSAAEIDLDRKLAGIRRRLGLED